MKMQKHFIAVLKIEIIAFADDLDVPVRGTEINKARCLLAL